jgi:hypothetical protein
MNFELKEFSSFGEMLTKNSFNFKERSIKRTILKNINTKFPQMDKYSTLEKKLNFVTKSCQ